MISTRGRYAIRVMMDIASHTDNEYVPLKDIAERQGLSKKYLEIIVKDLVKGGMLTGASGKGGGYKLCRKPSDYPLGEILELMEGTLSPVACLADKKYDCPRKKICDILSLWTEFDSLTHDFFYGKTLSDLI